VFKVMLQSSARADVEASHGSRAIAVTVTAKRRTEQAENSENIGSFSLDRDNQVQIECNSDKCGRKPRPCIHGATCGQSVTALQIAVTPAIGGKLR
jgi:hypothetical protein